MGWETTNFTVERHGELARVFNFEIIFSGEATKEQRLLRGDGLIMRDGKVRFNRADEIRGAAADVGMNPDRFLSAFADWVVSNTAPRLASVGTS